LDSDTFSDGKGSTIAKITDGTLRPAKLTAISAVANIGEDKTGRDITLHKPIGTLSDVWPGITI
jgi:alpha-glucuronidase